MQLRKGSWEPVQQDTVEATSMKDTESCIYEFYSSAHVEGDRNGKSVLVRGLSPSALEYTP
jgi:hypothetical protein